MYLAAGRIVDARRELDRIARDDFAALAPDHTWLGCIQFLADLCLALREPDRARALYRRALPFQDMVAAPYLATTCDGAVARGLGVLAHAMNDRATAVLHFRRALDIERRLASPPLIAATLVRYASLLLDRGEATDRDHARRTIDEATAISRELGIRLPLVELRAALGRGDREQDPGRARERPARASRHAREPKVEATGARVPDAIRYARGVGRARRTGEHE